VDDPLGVLAQALAEADIEYAVIGGHAVNAWLEPRFTADIDVTMTAGTPQLDRLTAALERRGFAIAAQYGEDQPSGPDFVRFESVDPRVVLEFQSAKTRLQDDVIRRAQQDERGLRVATPEDLIVLKLIANRPKDRIDLVGLTALPDLDWAYVEGCAVEWDLGGRLTEFRSE
jgi:hypothetical protein